jgi:hypothetical protein
MGRREIYFDAYSVFSDVFEGDMNVSFSDIGTMHLLDKLGAF